MYKQGTSESKLVLKYVSCPVMSVLRDSRARTDERSSTTL